MKSSDLPSPPRVLCIGGHDPSGGAGLQADIEAVGACGGIAQTLPSCLTVQDHLNARRVQAVDTGLFREMLDCLTESGAAPDAVKIGLMPGTDIIEIIARWLSQRPQPLPLVVDPVLRASGGQGLAGAGVSEALSEYLLPLTTVLTPNQQELLTLSGVTNLEQGARGLLDRGVAHVLVTGGDADDGQVINRLYGEGISETWAWPRLPYSTHGSGCTLAASLAAFLSRGESVTDACRHAQQYTDAALRHAVPMADGPRLPRRISPVS